MFLKESKRIKDGKEHHYWSLVENRRVDGGRKVVQRHVLYLGEINSSQQAAWRKTIEVFETGSARARTVALFPEERSPAVDDDKIVRIRLDQLELRRPRQWGACWLASVLYQKLGLDEFWSERLPASRKGTRWDHVLQTLVSYRLIDPGSEWRLHREWFDKSAMADLLGADYRLAADDTLYRCLDQLIEHKAALFSHLQQRWKDLFAARFDVLLYDLTSTYFESDPPFAEGDKRRFGYSRDKRFDCVQVVIALVVTPEGFPLGYEVLPGNTLDKKTLGSALASIEKQYGKARRVWVMDRGIPDGGNAGADAPERSAGQLPGGHAQGPFEPTGGRADRTSLAASPRGHHRQTAAAGGRVLRVCAERLADRQGTGDATAPAQGIVETPARAAPDEAADPGRIADEAGRCPPAMADGLASGGHPHAPGGPRGQRADLHLAAAQEPSFGKCAGAKGRYLLRTNLTEEDPAKLWEYYIQLTQVEEAFKNLKGDLALRPVYHQREDRIEAHIFVAFLAYCLHVTLRRWLRDLAPGLTPRSVLEKFAAVQMIDVHLPTTDGRHVILPRYTQPEKELQVLLNRMKLNLPEQPPPRISASGRLVD